MKPEIVDDPCTSDVLYCDKFKSIKVKSDSMSEELRTALEEKNIVIGTRQSIKYLKLKKAKLIVIASNCPENIRNDIEQYSKLTGIKVEKFDGTAKQLGVFCGKPFPIATLAIKVK